MKLIFFNKVVCLLICVSVTSLGCTHSYGPAIRNGIVPQSSDTSKGVLTAENLEAKGDSLIEKEPKEALALYEKALKIEPDNDRLEKKIDLAKEMIKTETPASKKVSKKILELVLLLGVISVISVLLFGTESITP